MPRSRDCNCGSFHCDSVVETVACHYCAKVFPKSKSTPQVLEDMVVHWCGCVGGVL